MHTFWKLAQQIAEHAQSSATRLQQEIFNLETAAAEKKTQLDAANLAHQRLANYQVKIGADYQCPRCWIERETRASLRAIGGSTATEEFFRCNKCDEKFALPTG